jgi:hypothetical protein
LRRGASRLRARLTPLLARAIRFFPPLLPTAR